MAPKKKKANYMVHPTAFIEKDVVIGEGTKIWHQAQIRQNAKIGENSVIGKNVFIDHDIVIGNNCKIQNNCSIFYRAYLEDGVFVGPHVCFTNDKVPRAIDPSGEVKSPEDWHVSTIRIKRGASIGAHSVILPDVTIGEFVLVGAGSVVTSDIPDHALVFGNPARVKDFVCRCGRKLKKIGENRDAAMTKCSCGIEIAIPKEIYKLKENNQNKRRIWLR